jgi:hypothetical protein
METSPVLHRATHRLAVDAVDAVIATRMYIVLASHLLC